MTTSSAPSFRSVFAEALGTALFVFIGCASVVANGITAGAVGGLGIAFAHGVGMAVLISALMSITGGYLNPAVSFGLLAAGKIDAKTFGKYVAAQLVGGVIGAALVKAVFPVQSVMAMSVGTPGLASMISFGQGVAIEALFTFILVSAVFGTAVSSEAPKIAGFGIGLSIFVAAIVVGPLTGAALNPARAFGPALVAMDFKAHAVYWIGPLVGGGLAGWVWRTFLLPRDPARL
ncbi:MAG TPA: aquaporin [Gemmatimonadales bacterium]|nr:aquaporin [Gemmatimonadales bacterium]